jgi:hypothetical protein
LEEAQGALPKDPARAKGQVSGMISMAAVIQEFIGLV